MDRPPFKFISRLTPEPTWSRYTFAVAVGALAFLTEVALGRFLSDPVTPFLPAFGAVIAGAAWAGFGPGVVTTLLSTIWCAVLLERVGTHTPMGIVIRCGMFAAEGFLLCVGSARMRRATREMAHSEDWHRKLVETSAEGVLVVDEKNTITYANLRTAEILGLDADSLPGRNIEEFFFPPDLSMERIRLRNRVAGLKEQFDRRLKRPDGTEVWVLVCSNPLLSADNRFTGVLSMMSDITERKRAESALRRSEARFRGLFENVPEGIYQSTPDGRILAANPMLLRMLGLTNESQLNDVNIASDLYVDAGVRRRLLDRLERDGSFQNVEYDLRQRNGDVIIVQENARVVRDEGGAVLYYEGTLADITERKRMEEQLREALNRQLRALDA